MRFAVLLIAALMMTAVPAFAATSYSPETERLSELNRSNPLQNPKFDRTAEVLSRRMLDRKNKVVGSIEDVVLNDNGNIAYLNVKFDRMQLNRPVFVNYSRFNVNPVSNGYAMTMNESEIESLYPELLADIQTAGGEEDTYSLHKMQGMKVMTTSGRTVGTVGDVLFSANGKRAEAIYVNLTTGNLRGKGVAIPFNQANFDNATIRELRISDEIANSMIDIAKN